MRCARRLRPQNDRSPDADCTGDRADLPVDCQLPRRFGVGGFWEGSDVTRNPILNACIELERAERDLIRAKDAADTRAIHSAQERLKQARHAVLRLGSKD